MLVNIPQVKSAPLWKTTDDRRPESQ